MQYRRKAKDENPRSCPQVDDEFCEKKSKYSAMRRSSDLCSDFLSNAQTSEFTWLDECCTALEINMMVPQSKEKIHHYGNCKEIHSFVAEQKVVLTRYIKTAFKQLCKLFSGAQGVADPSLQEQTILLEGFFTLNDMPLCQKPDELLSEYSAMRNAWIDNSLKLGDVRRILHLPCPEFKRFAMMTTFNLTGHLRNETGVCERRSRSIEQVLHRVEPRRRLSPSSDVPDNPPWLRKSHMTRSTRYSKWKQINLKQSHVHSLSFVGNNFMPFLAIKEK